MDIAAHWYVDMPQVQPMNLTFDLRWIKVTAISDFTNTRSGKRAVLELGAQDGLDFAGKGKDCDMLAHEQHFNSKYAARLAAVLATGLVFSFIATTFVAYVPSALADEVATTEAGRIARGGRLYDKWYAVIGADKPTETHIAWPASNDQKSGDTTWRCKSCHGWDYLGKDGAYATGSYQTGIGGIRNFDGSDTSAIVAILKDDLHALDGLMDEGDFEDLALFVSKGQIDLDTYVDRASQAPNGDAGSGQALFETVCANCHGADGANVPGMDPLGGVTVSNPWEVMHKIRFGQPDEDMPALFVFDPQVSADIMAYAATLPEER